MISMYTCMYFIIYDWMNCSWILWMSYFKKQICPKMPLNGFLQFFLASRCLFLKKSVPPWEVLQTAQALTGLSGDFFEHKRLTQQVQSKLSSQAPRAFQQVIQTPWRNSCFGDYELKCFFPKLVVENEFVFSFFGF